MIIGSEDLVDINRWIASTNFAARYLDQLVDLRSAGMKFTFDLLQLRIDRCREKRNSWNHLEKGRFRQRILFLVS